MSGHLSPEKAAAIREALIRTKLRQVDKPELTMQEWFVLAWRELDEIELAAGMAKPTPLPVTPRPRSGSRKIARGTGSGGPC